MVQISFFSFVFCFLRSGFCFSDELGCGVVVLLLLQGFGGKRSNRRAEERFSHQRDITFR